MSSAAAVRKCSESFVGQGGGLECHEGASLTSGSGLTGVKGECDGLEETFERATRWPRGCARSEPAGECGRRLNSRVRRVSIWAERRDKGKCRRNGLTRL